MCAIFLNLLSCADVSPAFSQANVMDGPAFTPSLSPLVYTSDLELAQKTPPGVGLFVFLINYFWKKKLPHSSQTSNIFHQLTNRPHPTGTQKPANQTTEPPNPNQKASSLSPLYLSQNSAGDASPGITSLPLYAHLQLNHQRSMVRNLELLQLPLTTELRSIPNHSTPIWTTFPRNLHYSIISHLKWKPYNTRHSHSH